MTLLYWNCRGLWRASAVRSLKDVTKSHHPQILRLIETKKKRKAWERLRLQLGFRNCFAVDRFGLSGGLALLWKEGIDVNLRSYSRFHIDVDVKIEKSFRFTLFYGNPVSNRRKESWDLLRQLNQGWEGPWLIAGDFNEVRFSWEARGVRDKDMSRMRQFNEVLDQCGLLDMGFAGSPFTYSNKRSYPFEAKARLDRVLGNIQMKNLMSSQ
ncbi:unnamed protein product [Rhodiola kirilowii]